MSTGSRIRALRKKRGLTQKQLGDLCGMADSAIRFYESDKGNPTEKTLKRIADALLTRVSDLTDPVAYDLGFREGSEAEAWQQFVIDELWKREGYTFSEREVSLINEFSELDDAGQGKVVEYAKDLKPHYRRQEPLQSTPPAPEGTDTTPPADAPERPQEDEE